MKKLWYLKTKCDIGYDEVDAFVIRAETESEARLIAYGEAEDEGGEIWSNPEFSVCEELTCKGESKVILKSYNAG